MTDSTPVHLFDLLSDLPGSLKAWSPNTTKTRMILNYKAVPYTESSISYPDVAPLLSHMSVEPHPEGSAPVPYTLPAIAHPSVTSNPSGVLMDSLPIALHLDELLPSRPLFPSGHASYALAVAVNELMYNISFSDFNLLGPNVVPFLDDRGKGYYVRTRSAWLGKSVLEIRPTEKEEIQKLRDATKKEMKPLVQMLKGKNGKTGPFFEGDHPGYADFIFVSFLFWYSRTDEDLWQEIMGLGDGEIQALWDVCLPWVKGQGQKKEWPITK